MASTTLEIPKLEPSAVVVFGGTGDLMHRKIVPAFYHLQSSNRLPADLCIVGFGRRDLTTQSYRDGLRGALEKFSHSQPDESTWGELAARIEYFRGDLEDGESYQRLVTWLESLPGAAKRRGNYLFYLSTAPRLFGVVAQNLFAAGLSCPDGNVPGSRRLIVEKPFGEDGASARQLTSTLQRCFAETDIFRIDHYLGKETVQNLLYFRFANTICEPLWSRRYIDHVQITVAEEVSVGSRGGYYDHTGAARDMLQNHLFQLLTLVAMEPPASLDAESIRDEKVKVLRSISTPSPREWAAHSVRAQYDAGVVAGQPIPAYRDADRVSGDSLTETYVALRLAIDNWRWSGVPFYVRTGKAMTERYSEIDIVYRRPPEILFALGSKGQLQQNIQRLRIQPEEGVHLMFNTKAPGRSIAIPVEMEFLYEEEVTKQLPDAYERLLMDALMGDSTLFTRADEVEEAWRLVDSVREAWASGSSCTLARYAAGTMGPNEADELLARGGCEWISS